MLLTTKNVSDFQELYKEAFKQEISTDEALEQGAKLIELIRATYRPITKEDHNKYKITHE